jgi:hypothetical protein
MLLCRFKKAAANAKLAVMVDKEPGARQRLLLRIVANALGVIGSLILLEVGGQGRHFSGSVTSANKSQESAQLRH